MKMAKIVRVPRLDLEDTWLFVNLDKVRSIEFALEVETLEEKIGDKTHTNTIFHPLIVITFDDGRQIKRYGTPTSESQVAERMLSKAIDFFETQLRDPALQFIRN